MTTNFLDLSNIKDHPAYFYSDKINSICLPLFSKFPINMFAYVFRYQDSMIILTSDKKWLCHFLQKEYPFSICGVKIHSWSTNSVFKSMMKGAANFGYYNGIFVEKPQSDFIEGLEFASPSQYNNPIEFCCNNDLLNQYGSYDF